MMFRCLALLALVSLGACAQSSHSFRAETRIDDAAGIDVRENIERAKAQIIEEGRRLGLNIERPAFDRLVLTGTVATQPATRPFAPIADSRRIVAEATFGQGPGDSGTYTYSIELVGPEPESTSPEHELFVLRSMLLVRSVFEQPLTYEVDSQAR